jgi:hypothetical protein
MEYRKRVKEKKPLRKDRPPPRSTVRSDQEIVQQWIHNFVMKDPVCRDYIGAT